MKSDEELTVEFTGARVVHHNQDLNYFLHQAAYEFVSPFVTGLDVLDAGCRTGYADEVLIDTHARTYIGVDAAPDAIAFAHSKYPLSRASFALMDALSLGFASDNFDLVCSFQVVEHLPDARSYLREIARVVKQEGVYVVSTPNRLFRKRGTTSSNSPTVNPFHVREYVLEELRMLLAHYWDSITIWRQILPVYDASLIQKAYDRLYSLFPTLARSTLKRWMPFSPQVLAWRATKAKSATRDSVFAKEGEFPISQCRTFLAVCHGPRLW